MLHKSILACALLFSLTACASHKDKYIKGFSTEPITLECQTGVVSEPDVRERVAGKVDEFLMRDEILSAAAGELDMSNPKAVFYKKLGDTYLAKYLFFDIFWGLDGGDGIMIVADLCNEVVVHAYRFTMHVSG